MNLLGAAARVSGLTLVSRITGLLRDLLIARIFGAGGEMDAFTVAFRLPNLLRRLFAEGAFSQAFVPIFGEVRTRRGPERTRELLSHVASALFWVLLVVSAAGVAGASWLVVLIADGFERTPAVFELATLMTRWMFPYILFMSLIACSAGVLNTFSRFAVPAFTPVLLNLSMIAMVLVFGRSLQPPALVLALAVVAGGLLQLAVQVPALARIGMLPRLSSLRAALADPDVRRILRQMLPAVFAVSVAQLSLIINTKIASHLGIGSNSWLYYADRMMEFPTGLLGVALGTILLPGLSQAHANGRADDYSRLLDWGLRLTCLVALPASLALGLLAEGLMAALFQGGVFRAHDVLQSALALRGYAVGLFGLIAVKILAPGFYAKQDIRTPVRIGVMVLLATQLANLVLVPLLAHAALALSISLGALANAALLLRGLRRRGVYQPLPGWPGFLGRLGIALAALVVLLWAMQRWMPLGEGSLSLATRIGWLAAVVTAAVLVYGGTLLLLGFRLRDFVLRSR